MVLESLPATPQRRSALQIQRSVLFALVVRELRARVQGRWLGLLWMLAEPLAHVLLLVALFGFRRGFGTTNVELPVFLVTGLLPFFMFRNLARRLPQAVRANRGLFAYRQVLPFDAMLARAIVEVGLYGAVYLVALALLGWLGYHWLPSAPLELIAVGLTLVGLGTALGFVLAVAVHERPRVDTVVGLAFIPLYLLSGVIFPLHNLAPEIREWLLWNPVLHLVELFRACSISAYQPLPGVALGYPLAVTIVLAALAMSLYRVFRHDFVTDV